MYTRSQIRYELMSGANIFSKDIQTFVNGILDELARSGATVVSPVMINPVQATRANPLTMKPEAISVIVVQIDYTEQVSDLEGIPDDDDIEPAEDTVTGVTGTGDALATMMQRMSHHA